jgi:hypothetical protein
MTRKIDLNASQIASIQSGNQATCDGITVPQGITARTSFVYFAAFDGTNNDKDNVPRGELCTNVAQLWQQYDAGRAAAPAGTAFGGGYYKGPGAQGTLSQSAALPERVTEQVIVAAEDAYHNCCSQAVAAGAGQDVAVVLTSFSRGGASAAIFSQMIFERGLLNPDTRQELVPAKKVPVVGGVIFDPVMTGVSKSLAYPPNVRNLVDLRALNEYRYLFRGAEYRNHPPSIINTYDVYGNHCDVGGGYDSGLAGLTLATATRLLQQLGLPIAKVPPQRVFRPGEIAVHTEEYDAYGNKIWDVTNEDGFSFADVRLMEGIGSPASPNLAGRDRFVMYNGDIIYLS